MLNVFKLNKYLVNFQHDFKTKRSNQTTITELIDAMYELFNNKQKRVTLFFDFHCTCDMIYRNSLLQKVYQISVTILSPKSNKVGNYL